MTVLLSLLQDENLDVRSSTALALGQLAKTSNTIPIKVVQLLELSRDENGIGSAIDCLLTTGKDIKKLILNSIENTKKERIMILSFFAFTLAIIALVFKFLSEHLGAFFKLALTCRTAFTFIISPFVSGGFPTF
jgi:hypothetical protein